jgi:prophage regulatory protein
MSGPLVEHERISAVPHRRGRGLRTPPAQSVEKKMPHTQSQVVAAGDNGTPSNMVDVTFIRLPEVKAVTGLSKTTIYELIRGKDFPAPVRLGPRVVAWVKSEVRQWAVGRVQASRSAA